MRWTCATRVERGTALVVVLVVLVVVAIVAATVGVRGAREQRLSALVQQRHTAFQAAEAALLAAEATLNGLTVAPLGPTASLPCIHTAGSVNPLDDAVWAGAGACAMASPPPGLAAPPRYLIEPIGRTSASLDVSAGGGTTCYYRIAARGWGTDANTQVTLETTYARPCT